ncbi:MAG: DinB family protein, partial [Chloroflexota bacterium]
RPPRVGDDMLEGEWRWRATDTDDVELRYAYFAIHERLERAIGAIEVGRAAVPDGDLPLAPAVPYLGAMTAARWDLHGLLVGLPAATWDEDPGGGEWTIRQTLGHILGVQLSYSWYNAWFLSHPAPVGIAERPSDDVMPPEPTEEELAAGTAAEVAARLDSIVDASAAAAAALDEASLQLGARWSGLAVSVGHRLGRYGSHIREHAIQVDKTLAMLHREPSEVERLVRLVLATYGRLEALVIGRTAADLDRSLAGGLSAIAILTEAIADAEATAISARRRSSAG